MVLSIPISQQAEIKLRERAALAGVDIATYAARHLELIATPSRSLREISGPIADAFARTGITDDELADFLEQEKHAMRAEWRAKQAK